MIRPAVDYATTPYPGEVPASAYCLDAGVVHPLSTVEEGYLLPDGRLLVEWLSARSGLRVPLLTYGSNACPGRLAEKFGDDVDGVVCLPAVLHGAVRVWSSQLSSRGSRPSTLAQAPEGREDVHVLLVPQRYGPQLDRSEGRGGPYYVLGRLPTCAVVLPPPLALAWLGPLSYLGVADRGPQVVDGRPVARTPGRQHVLDALSPRQADDWLPPVVAVPSNVPLSAATPDDIPPSLLALCHPQPGVAHSTAI